MIAFQRLRVLLFAACLSTVRSVSAQPLTITHLAGTPGGAGWFDGTGSGAHFTSAAGIAADSAGNLFVADAANHTIRKVQVATGAVTTLAGSAGVSGSADGTGSAALFHGPCSLAADGAEYLYVGECGNFTIRKIVVATGVVSTLAGTAGQNGSSDGTGPAARFSYVAGLALGTSGDLYAADSGNNTIRKIRIATGVVTTVAGSPGSGGAVDGPGSAARFLSPGGVALDGSGNLYVADSGNGTIRKVVLGTGWVSTIAGLAGESGSIDGIGSEARFYSPLGVTFDGSGNLLVADYGNDTIRKVDLAAGVVTTLAGGARLSGSSDGVGSVARFNGPQDVAADRNGSIYVTDGGRSVRKIVIASATVTTLVGAESAGSGDGTGSSARFSYPSGVAADSGNLYVADSGNHTIRKIVIATGAVTTFAGSAGVTGSADGVRADARFNWPWGLAADGAGNLYVGDFGNNTVRKIVIATGAVSTLAGTPGSGGSADGIGGAARFRGPAGLVIDDAGNLYAVDRLNDTIRKIVVATGAVTTLAGVVGDPYAAFDHPGGLALDGNGHLYVADAFHDLVQKVDVGTGAVTAFAGGGGPGSGDGTGSSAQFYGPEDVVPDGDGNLFVVDGGNATIRKIVISSRVVTTPAGAPGTNGCADGTGADARFDLPSGIARDALGNLYISDHRGHAIRMGLPTLPDAASVDAASGPVAGTHQLDTFPQTATSWRWEEVRVPSASNAALTATSIRNPTFTPDAPGLYEFQLTATNGAATSITRVRLNAFLPPTAEVGGGGTLCAGQSGTIEAFLTGQSPWSVTWSDGVLQNGLTVSPVTRTVSPTSSTVYSVTSISDANAPGTPSGSANVVVNAGSPPDAPFITAPASVTSASAGNLAIVPLHAGSIYWWDIAGGVITAGQGTSQVTFSAWAAGSVVLSVSETVAGGCTSAAASVSVPIIGLRLYTLAPCRLLDTRNATGRDAAFPALAAGETRSFVLAGACGMPASAKALAVNATAVAPSADGFLTLFPGDLYAAPGTSSLSFRNGQTRAVSSVVPLAGDGSGTVKILNGSGGAADVVLDVSGYFQ